MATNTIAAEIDPPRLPFDVDLDQSAERFDRRAARLSGIAPIRSERISASRTLDLRRNCARAVGNLVLARATNRATILSASFLWRRRDSADGRGLVLENCSRNYDFESYSVSLYSRERGRICDTIHKLRPALSMVARRDDPFHHRCRVRQPPSVVSAPARADCSCICRRGLRIFGAKNSSAESEDHLRRFISRHLRRFCFELHAEILPAFGNSTLQRRFGVKANHPSGIFNCGGRLRRFEAPMQITIHRQFPTQPGCRRWARLRPILRIPEPMR